MADARETLKSICPHELLSNETDVSFAVVEKSCDNQGNVDLTTTTTTTIPSSPLTSKHAHLCVKLKADAMLDAGAEAIVESVEDVVHVATVANALTTQQPQQQQQP